VAWRGGRSSLTGGSTRVQIQAKSWPAFLRAGPYQSSRKKISARRNEGRVVTTKAAKNSPGEQQGFSTGDVLWAVGIWSVILTLSPVVIFYVLMVN
jgi:hypothetical protein